MSEALAILRAEFDSAAAARQFHKERGPRLGNVEAACAAFKMAWLKEIIAKCEKSAPK